MKYTEWYEGVVEKIQDRRPIELWLNSMWFGLFVLLLTSAYWLLQVEDFNLWVFNRALASTAFILVGLSFALSGLCYFWDFVDTKIIYRKYIGIVGFYIAVIHMGTSIGLLRGVTDFFDYYRVPTNFISAIFAIAAIGIFFGMVIISNEYAVHELGTTRWRALLRVGYLGIGFTAIHFIVRRYEEWWTWLQTFDPVLPPMSFLLLVFAVFILGLRTALWVSVSRKEVATDNNIQ